MATWNMGQYDDIKNDAQRIYTRQRQDVLDKRAAEEAEKQWNYKLERDKKADEYAEKQWNYKLERDKKADDRYNEELKYQRGEKAKINAIEEAQRQSKLRNEELQQRLLEIKIKEQQDKIQEIQDKKEYAKTNFTPLQKAVLKFRATGGNVNALTKDEQILIAEYGQLDKKFNYDNNYTGSTYFDYVRNSGDQYLRDLGLNPSFVKLFANDYATQYTKKQEKEYKAVALEMTSLFNKFAKSGAIDPKIIPRKETVEAAVQFYIDSLKNGNKTTLQQAFERASGMINTNGEMSDKEWIPKLDIMYGSNFRSASTEKQTELIEASKEIDNELKEMLSISGKTKPAELDLNQLRTLDALWKNIVNDEKFYSPFQDEIFIRELKDLYAQRDHHLEKISYNRKTGKFGMPVKGFKEIDDAIKMREQILSKRGIKIEEYK